MTSSKKRISYFLIIVFVFFSIVTVFATNDLDSDGFTEVEVFQLLMESVCNSINNSEFNEKSSNHYDNLLDDFENLNLNDIIGYNVNVYNVINALWPDREAKEIPYYEALSSDEWWILHNLLINWPDRNGISDGLNALIEAHLQKQCLIDQNVLEMENLVEIALKEAPLFDQDSLDIPPSEESILENEREKEQLEEEALNNLPEGDDILPDSESIRLSLEEKEMLENQAMDSEYRPEDILPDSASKWRSSQEKYMLEQNAKTPDENTEDIPADEQSRLESEAERKRLEEEGMERSKNEESVDHPPTEESQRLSDEELEMLIRNSEKIEVSNDIPESLESRQRREKERAEIIERIEQEAKKSQDIPATEESIKQSEQERDELTKNASEEN